MKTARQRMDRFSDAVIHSPMHGNRLCSRLNIIRAVISIGNAAADEGDGHVLGWCIEVIMELSAGVVVLKKTCPQCEWVMSDCVCKRTVH